MQMEGYRDNVNDIQFLFDGKRIVLALNNGEIGIWDMLSVEKIHGHVWKEYTYSIIFFRWSSCLLEIQRLKKIQPLTAIDVSSDDNTITSVYKDGVIQLWKCKKRRFKNFLKHSFCNFSVFEVFYFHFILFPKNVIFIFVLKMLSLFINEMFLFLSQTVCIKNILKETNANTLFYHLLIAKINKIVYMIVTTFNV
ncbi:hypothetical protein RFI_25782 [Reticulomyxa filosa]|uniref:Uncharacterized protein n=1 Tax=Reticulomyxa filosa TaxID=46433 RepID=X6MCJ3_RETFI|nr:hypothetical protein RFI_25782 [Reticulomyxa filosa]|eukprot:ETO11594.1 hypothetical protein RFI_25782 [Reticulomyxa filosa]